ncbi:MAG: LacI family transcriptional regulator [Lacunisphaera sp.]|nr:LacI family transcriptional regulator [Lacunisphaera sp.]
MPMKSNALIHNVIEFPNRVDLATRVADVIQQTIRRGIWGKDIPSERRMSELLNVSRPTIRAALHKLAKNGLLEIRPRTRKRLLVGLSHPEAPRGKVVGIITNDQITSLSGGSYIQINELIARLKRWGVGIEIFVCNPPGESPEPRKLANFIKTTRASCYLLLHVSKAVQEWLSVRSLPALVLGSCYDTVRLPSFEVNLWASCRHAVGIFLRNSHRRLALILPDTGLAGDLASERGFRDAVDSHNATAKDKARIVIVRHNDTAPGVTAKLKILFRSPDAPTAMLVAKPGPTFTTIIFLLKHGLAVPESVSVIARDQDQLYEIIDPLVSHYRFKHSSYTRLATRLVSKILRQGNLPAAKNMILPEFFEGGTVAPPPGDLDPINWTVVA